MIAFAGMLVNPAKVAGIAVPADPKKYDPKEFPHWHVYVTVQLGASMPYPSAHFNNAQVVAEVPAGHIMEVTLDELKEKGLALGMPIL